MKGSQTELFIPGHSRKEVGGQRREEERTGDQRKGEKGTEDGGGPRHTSSAGSSVSQSLICLVGKSVIEIIQM